MESMDMEWYNTTDDFLAQLPVALLKENIKTQMKDPENYRVDYVDRFIDSYKQSVALIEDSDDEETISELRDDFVGFLEDLFEKKLHIGFVDLDEDGEEEMFDKLQFTYRFFVLNLRKNFQNFIWNYLMENRDHFVETAARKNDITIQTFRKEISEEDSVILANLDLILDQILESDTITIDDFLRLCQSEEDSNTEWAMVSEWFDKDELTGNFYPYYARMVTSLSRVFIEGDIRHRILKSYRTNLDKA